MKFLVPHVEGLLVPVPCVRTYWLVCSICPWAAETGVDGTGCVPE